MNERMEKMHSRKFEGGRGNGGGFFKSLYMNVLMYKVSNFHFVSGK